MMYQIDGLSRTPVYEQIINQTERFLMLGILKEGDRMPSVRSLAAELSVNPNTIQKAFGIMDQKGLITSVPGRGCFIREKAAEMIRQERRAQLDELKRNMRELMLAGITAEELHQCIREIESGKDDEEI